MRENNDKISKALRRIDDLQQKSQWHEAQLQDINNNANKALEKGNEAIDKASIANLLSEDLAQQQRQID